MTRTPDPDDTCFVCLKPIIQPATGRPRIYCSDRCRQQKRRAYNYHGWRDPQHYAKVHRRAARELKRMEKRTGPIDDTPHPEWGISLRYRVLFRLQRDMPIPECVQCGRFYVVDAPGPFPEFCSAKCHQEYVKNEQAVKKGLIDHAGNYDLRVDVRVRLGLPIRACEHCNMPFPIYNPRKWFCSATCRKAHWRKQHPTCPRCGDPVIFTLGHPNKQFCSELCRRRAAAARRNGWLIKVPDRSPRLCAECGDVFTPHPRAKGKTCFCSNICRNRAKKRMQRLKERSAA